MDDRLWIHVVFDHPKDHPNHVVVRKQCAGPDGQVLASRTALRFTSLDDARTYLANLGLTCLPRFPEDDPVIVETWL